MKKLLSSKNLLRLIALFGIGHLVLAIIRYTEGNYGLAIHYFVLSIWILLYAQVSFRYNDVLKKWGNTIEKWSEAIALLKKLKAKKVETKCTECNEIYIPASPHADIRCSSCGNHQDINYKI